MPMRRATNPTALRVQATLGEGFEVLEFDTPTRTAAEAAEAIGCELERIAKSLVFRAASGRAVLVVASGPNRVDAAKVAAVIGEPVGKADAAFVRDRTGFAIGGIPPIGHEERLATVIDETLGRHTEIWAAAGTPNAVFRLAFSDLVRLTGGKVADIVA
jgi:prolyl-tRNA editing enzyme YbaK/EbsC (Cys-tRNA(Pro) deacylase)